MLYQSETRAFDGVAAWRFDDGDLGPSEADQIAVRVRGARVTANFFDVLGVPPPRSAGRSPRATTGLTNHLALLLAWLLCVDCEHFVNTQYEKPFRDYWYGKPALPRTPEKRTLLTLDDLDYRTFKLFHLLILWRSSVATLEAFTPVSLGPYEARIRQMLISGDPGPVTFVQILGVVLVDPRDGTVHDRTVMYPGDYRWEGRRMYNCMFGGCGWFYIVAKHPSIGFQEQMLTEAGRIVMPVFDLIQSYPYFSQFIARYRQMGSSS